MTKVYFSGPAQHNRSQYGAYGRNGPMSTIGVKISTLGDDLEIRTITSRNQISDSARINIPLQSIDSVVDTLRSLKRRMRLQADGRQRPVTAEDLDGLAQDDRIAIARNLGTADARARLALMRDPEHRIRRAARAGAFALIGEAFTAADRERLLDRMQPDVNGEIAGRPLDRLPTPLVALFAANGMHRLIQGAGARLDFWPEAPLLQTIARIEQGTPVMDLIAGDPLLHAPAPGTEPAAAGNDQDAPAP